MLQENQSGLFSVVKYNAWCEISGKHPEVQGDINRSAVPKSKSKCRHPDTCLHKFICESSNYFDKN